LSLREKLKALEELQQIDLDATGVRGEAEGIPVRRAEIDAVLAVAKKAYEAEKSRIEDNERERRQIESLLGMERDKVKKWEARLGDIKTPREYAALSREIDIARKTNDSQSEQLRQLATTAIELRKVLDTSADALSEKEMAAKEEVDSLSRREADFATRLRELEVRRGEPASRYARWWATPAAAATATSRPSSASCCGEPIRSRAAPTATASSTRPRR